MFVNVREFSREYEYKDYWDEQIDRIKNGYSVGGVKITGDHYSYLNFAQIKLTNDDSKSGFGSLTGVVKDKKSLARRKVRTFPDFWDGDYDYYWTIHIARNGISKKDYENLNLGINIKESDLTGGKHVVVGKSRRKGFSYKNSNMRSNRYHFYPNSISLIGAYDKDYLVKADATMTMAINYINFIDKHTAYNKRRLKNKVTEEIKAGYEYQQNGIWLTGGYQSSIICESFYNNPGAARGKDAELILLEEAGKFPQS